LTPSPGEGDERGALRARIPVRVNAGWLLAALLSLFVVIPVLQSSLGLGSLGEQGRRGVLHYVVIAILLVAATTVAQSSRPWTVIAMLAGVPTVLGIAERLVGESDARLALETARDVYTGLALLYVVWRGLVRLVGQSAVTAETIAVAICAYLLIGLAWQSLYEACVTLSPGAFGDARVQGSDLFYFSYVTLTTLGYGDITPKMPVARSLAVVEAIVGQMYVAVVIARLVATYLGTPAGDDARG